MTWSHVLQNPARSFRPTTNTAGKKISPFESWAEVEAVAARAGHYGPPVRFACATGLRPQEWAALRWLDVDLAAGTLRVQRTIQAGEVTEAVAKTRHSLRTVLLQDRAVEVLRGLPTPLRRDQFLFTDESGNRINTASFRRNVFNAAVTAAGLSPRSPKEMRHTFATLALARGAQLQDVARQLGHTDIKTTLDYYVRWLPAMDERFLEALNAAGDASPMRRDEAASA